MKKKIIAFMLALAGLACSITAVSAFDDVNSGEWYTEAVNYMVDSGYMNGVSDTEFAPNDGMTRGMFVTVLGRMDGTPINSYTKKIFPDVNMDMWYAPYVSWAFENNIVSGFSDLSFHPDEQLNRFQLAVMLKRYIDYSGMSLQNNPNAYELFADESSIPDWAKEGAELMRTTGIITGDSYGRFLGSSPATRAQIASIIMRLRMVMNGNVLNIPERELQSNTEIIIENMSLKEKIYQMIAITPEQLTGVGNVTMAGTVTKDAISSYPVGALLYNADNVISTEQIKEMIDKTKEYSKVAPFAMVSEETGAYAAVSKKLGKECYKDAYDYRNDDAAVVKNIYNEIGITLKECGFDVNLAPVCDLWTNTSNIYIGKRAFGNRYEECASNSTAAINGIKESGIEAAMKYFPGYGNSAASPLNDICLNDKTLDDLKNYDFNSYKDAIDAGANFAVCAHVYLKNIDPYYPASLSTIFIQDLLKNELGFNGIVMTDDFRKQAITQKYSSGAAAVKAIDAGCDMILCPADHVDAVNEVINAVEKGDISENRINESVIKILNFKENMSILK